MLSSDYRKCGVVTAQTSLAVQRDISLPLLADCLSVCMLEKSRGEAPVTTSTWRTVRTTYGIYFPSEGAGLTLLTGVRSIIFVLRSTRNTVHSREKYLHLWSIPAVL